MAENVENCLQSKSQIPVYPMDPGDPGKPMSPFGPEMPVAPLFPRGPTGPGLPRSPISPEQITKFSPQVNYVLSGFAFNESKYFDIELNSQSQTFTVSAENKKILCFIQQHE